jgi:sucrose-phosphate synthase
VEKEDLAAELPAFTSAFCAYLSGLRQIPDIIHAHFADAAAVALAAQMRFGIPFIYTPHALGIDKRSEGGSRLEARIEAERLALRTAAAIIASSQDEADCQIGRYQAVTGDRVRIVPPGVPQRPRTKKQGTIVDRLGEWLLEPQRAIILAIARPVRKKNLAALLRAYAGDGWLQESANLVILAGQHRHANGEERAVLEELQALCRTPQLTGKVALPSMHDADDVAALYQLAAEGGIFVNPALHEPFGLTVVEAADAGVPVVATCNGGPGEIIDRIGHGLIFDPHDEDALAAALTTILSDAAMHQRFAAAGRAGVKAYSWARYAERSVEIYREARAPGLLVCDIDNTLTGCRRGAADFAAWHSRSDLPFAVATGRDLTAACAILDQWRLPLPDAFIVDVGTRIMLADGKGGWIECADYAAILDQGWDRRAVAATLASLAIDPQPSATAGPHKISFFGDAVDAALIQETLAQAGLAARVVFSHDRLIDVLSPAGGKAAAIAHYARLSGLTLAQCVAAGDSGNDADMLAACGSAIVVGNASRELDGLPRRDGLYRATASHAGGVLEGLARLGLVSPAFSTVCEAA